MIDLSEYQELVVRQEVEHLEAFTGIETENRYSVSTPDGEQLLYAYEESGFLARMFLKSHRPLEIHVVDGDDEHLITAGRGFFWFLSHLHVRDGSGREIGSLRRRFSVLNRRFELEDSRGALLAEIRGPRLRPNTFMVYKQGEEIGRVTKQWSGIGKEVFTDADTFRVQIDTGRADRDFSLLMLASALAIDLDFFES
jgi:uncharacterized protein YxjI